MGGPQYAGPSRPSGAPLRPPPRRSRGRLVLGGLVGLLAVAAVVVGVVVLTGGKHASSASRSSAGASLASHRTSSLSAVQPSTVTVSVLNGTDQVGPGRRGGQPAQGQRLPEGSHVANASDQTQATTVVAYMEPAFRRDALAVATSLKLHQSSVQLIDSGHQGDRLPAQPGVHVRGRGDRRQRSRHPVAPGHARAARPPGAERQAAERWRHPRDRSWAVDRRDRGDDRGGRRVRRHRQARVGDGAGHRQPGAQARVLPVALDSGRAGRDPDRAGHQPRPPR